MTITIKIKTDNEAFTDDKEAEIVRIVKEWITVTGVYPRNLRDFNGNTVGSVTVRGK